MKDRKWFLSFFFFFFFQCWMDFFYNVLSIYLIISSEGDSKHIRAALVTLVRTICLTSSIAPSVGSEAVQLLILGGHCADEEVHSAALFACSSVICWLERARARQSIGRSWAYSACLAGTPASLISLLICLLIFKIYSVLYICDKFIFST